MNIPIHSNKDILGVSKLKKRHLWPQNGPRSLEPEKM
jgi:hypothetical protein